MSLFRRGLMMASKAKPYDAEVEWLESNPSTGGRAYIDTLITTSNNITFEISANVQEAYNTFLLGSRVEYDVNQMTLMVVFTAGQIWWGYGNRTATWSTTLSTGDYAANNMSASRTLVINNHSITATAATFSNSLNMYLFAANDNGSVLQNANAVVRIKSCKLYSSGTLVRYYIPVRKNGVGYLYDKVSQTLFGNAGSGAFTYGNDK